MLGETAKPSRKVGKDDQHQHERDVGQPLLPEDAKASAFGRPRRTAHDEMQDSTIARAGGLQFVTCETRPVVDRTVAGMIGSGGARPHECREDTPADARPTRRPAPLVSRAGRDSERGLHLLRADRASQSPFSAAGPTPGLGRSRGPREPGRLSSTAICSPPSEIRSGWWWRGLRLNGQRVRGDVS
jgi:hypothetical protein